MNTGFGYLALFSEIGLVLLVTTLAGVAAGYWVDQQLGTQPLFVLVGFLAGAGLGAFGDPPPGNTVPEAVGLTGHGTGTEDAWPMAAPLLGGDVTRDTWVEGAGR